MINELENKYICTYCGATSECREHVIPVCYLSLSRNYDPRKSWIVPSCNSCNSLAGAFIAFSIPEKARYITTKFKNKYRKFLKQPEWTQEELDELDYKLKTMIWGSMVAKRVASERLKVLETVSTFSPDFKRPDFVENQIKEALSVYNVKQKKKVKKKGKKK